MRRGDIFALLGSNGAGKTTTVNILATLLKPDRGSARVCGFDTQRQPNRVREQISLTGQFAAVAGILALFTLALTWLAVIPRLTAKSIDGASAFAYPLLFLPFISSAFVPTDTMPTPVRVFAAHQPVTAIVETLRSFFTARPVGSDSWTALAWCVGVAILAYAFAMRAYTRVP